MRFICLSMLIFSHSFIERNHYMISKIKFYAVDKKSTIQFKKKIKPITININKFNIVKLF